MRIAVVTLVVSLAATVALTAPSAGASAPADQSHWSSPVALGSEFGVDLLVAPDGSAQVHTFRYTPQICPPGATPRTSTSAAPRVPGRRPWTPWTRTTVTAAAGTSATRAAGPDTKQVTIRSRPSGGAWGAAEDVPDAILPAGNISAQLSVHAGRPPGRGDDAPGRRELRGFRIAERRGDGTWLTSARSTTSAHTPAVATAAGAVRVAWSSDGTAVVIAERLSDGSWAPDSTVPGRTGPRSGQVRTRSPRPAARTSWWPPTATPTARGSSTTRRHRFSSCCRGAPGRRDRPGVERLRRGRHDRVGGQATGGLARSGSDNSTDPGLPTSPVTRKAT